MVDSYGSIVPMTLVATESTHTGVKEQRGGRRVASLSVGSTKTGAKPSVATATVPLLPSNSHHDEQAEAVQSRSGSEHPPSANFSRETISNPMEDSDVGLPIEDSPIDLAPSFDRDARPNTVAVTAGAVANLCSATLGAGALTLQAAFANAWRACRSFAIPSLDSFVSGSGVLALPFALRQAGLVVGLVLLLGAASATVASVGILVQAHSYYGYDTYESLAQAVVSIRCRHAVEACLLVFCAGCAVAYVIAVGDIAQQVGIDTTGWIPGVDSRTVILLLAYLTAMLPLSLLRRVQSLQCASCFSIVAILFLVVASFLHWMRFALAYGSHVNRNDTSLNAMATMPFLTGQSFSSQEHEDKVRLSDFLWPAEGLVSVLTACPIVLFAFSCQPNVCSIYHELQIPSTSHGGTPMPLDEFHKQQMMRRVTIIAVLICAALYASISIIALADFGSHVESNMLSCYVNAGPIVQCATAAMAVAIILAFPLNIFPARVTLLGLISKYSKYSLQSFTPHSSWDVQETGPNEGLTAALLQDDSDTTCLVPSHNEASRADDQRVDEAFPDRIVHLSIHGGSENRICDDDVARSNTEEEGEDFNLKLHVLTTVFLTGLTLILALILPNISVVFGLLGGTASSILGFCVPGLLGMRMALDLQQETGEWHRRMMGTSWLLLCGGVAVGCLTTGVTIYTTLIQPSRK